MQQAHPLTVKESQLEDGFRMFIFHSCVALEDQALLICCGLWKRKRGVSGWLGLQQHRLQVQNPVSKFQGRRRGKVVQPSGLRENSAVSLVGFSFLQDPRELT